MRRVLKHYGTPRHSGRYPWGSGGDPYQRSIDFRGHVKELKKQGLSDVEIAEREGINTSQLRARLSLAKDEIRVADRARAIQLKEHGYSNMEIARRMSGPEKTWNESSVRSLLDPVLAERASITKATANMLKEQVDKKRFIDVGSGVEVHLNITATRLKTAIAELEEQGYKLHTINVKQLGLPDQFTIVKVLGAPDTEWKELRNNIGLIQSVDAYSNDFGRSFNTSLGLKPLEHISSKRVQIRYAEEGGSSKDGVIELRRGLKDLDLGASKYAQVRISVEGTHFLKGMAIYSDDLPKGTDIVFNTNKSKNVPMMGPKDNTVLKPMKADKDNPFGATIKRQNGAINIVNEEGDWDKWSKTISSQILSKQTVPLAKAQLGEAFKQKQEEHAEIMSVTNPVVKRKLLMAFAGDCDSSAVHLKAAALPRQASKVILPIPGLKENEVYAPTFDDGETVVLIRHPHAGRFEIPQLTVNNKSQAAKSIMHNAVDAIGIHPKVAQKLSGADFDGDAVIVIPNNSGKIKSAPSLKGLENFDPIESYRIPAGSKIPPISPRTKQTKMGEVSNLITDMTIKGAPPDEMALAVRHSMVVIDSEKHNLDYRQSYKDHRIAALSAKYQNSARGGASTLVSKASSELRVDERKPRSAKEGGPFDKETGAKVYTKTGETYTNRKGKVIRKLTSTTKMAEATDARKLSSGTPIEEVYATHANSLKALANSSRKTALSITPTPYSPSAAKTYAKEVASLNANLRLALRKKPIERKAQILANTIVNRKKQDNPDMDADELKKIRNQALAEARTRTGASKYSVVISPKEWEAIQAGAVSPSKLAQIIENANLDHIKQLATPRANTTMSASKITRAQTLIKSGATIAEVANVLGVSASIVSNALKQ